MDGCFYFLKHPYHYLLFLVLLFRLGIGLELEVKLELVHLENGHNELKPSFFFFLNQAKLEPDFKLVQKLGLGSSSLIN